MNPETQLAIVVVFTGFVLKTSLGFCICWAMSKVVVSPHRKFLIWFGFLVGAACYWLWLAGYFLPSGASPIALQTPLAWTPRVPVGNWQIETSWAFPLSIALRGLGALYLIALSYFLFAYIKKQARLRWVLRFSYRAPTEIENIFRPIAESFDTGDVHLLMLSGIYSPATFGWYKPVILLPPFCLEQKDSELGYIFRHELQHIQRRDFVFNAIASFCRALLFFHPAVWYAMRRLKLESELACDLAVVSDSPERRARYAECLVRFAKLDVAQEPAPWNLDFARSSVQLKARIRSMLTETKKIPGWLLCLRATVGLLLLAGFLDIVPSLFIVLSYQQHRVAQSVVTVLPAPHTRVQPRRGVDEDKARLQGPMVQTSHAFTSPVISTAAVEAAVDAGPIVARNPNTIPSNGPGPTLKRRGDASATPSSESVPATIIPLSNQPSPHPADSIARRMSIASAIAAGASEAANVASHGHDRDGH